jgi:hypothetical protein
MADSYDRPLRSPVGGDSLKVGSKVAFFAAGGTPSALAELLPEPSAPLARLAAEAFSSAFIVSRTDSSPGSQVISGRKLVHINPDFSNHRPRRSPIKTGISASLAKLGGRRLLP